MCVLVRFVPSEALPAFDAEARQILIPTGLSPAHTVTLVRAILTELLVPQPTFGAVCWCGEVVNLTTRVPSQRRSDQVVKHGA